MQFLANKNAININDLMIQVQSNQNLFLTHQLLEWDMQGKINKIPIFATTFKFA